MWMPLVLIALVAPAAIEPATTDAKLVAMYIRNGVAELGLDASTPDGRARIAQLERAVRDEFLDREIVLDEAERRGLPIAERLDARRTRWIVRFGGETAYRAYLAEHRLTAAEFDRVIRQEIAGELLHDALAREIRVGDDEIAAFYHRERTNPALEPLFVQPETVTAAHILVAARPGVHADIDARRSRAEAIRRELLAGADFAALARRHSEDAGTRARGGDLGAFTRDTHTAGFDEAAFALKAGETSGIVRTEFGFHIIRVTAKSPRRVRTLDELRDAIEARLRTEKVARHLRSWLEERRALNVDQR